MYENTNPLYDSLIATSRIEFTMASASNECRATNPFTGSVLSSEKKI